MRGIDLALAARPPLRPAVPLRSTAGKGYRDDRASARRTPRGRMRHWRRALGLRELVQIHHVLPRQHAAHPLLRNFGMEGAANLMFLPTRAGQRALRLHPARPTHDGGHPAYNVHVRTLLDEALLTETTADELCRALRRRLRGHDRAAMETLPWQR